jgi:Zn-finger nucleic acid-binding protein
VIDTCHRCHLIWLDAGELSVIGAYQGRAPAAILPPSPHSPAGPVDDVVIDLFGFDIRLG